MTRVGNDHAKHGWTLGPLSYFIPTDVNAESMKRGELTTFSHRTKKHHTPAFAYNIRIRTGPIAPLPEVMPPSASLPLP
jgi:hypothetical protein